VHEGGFACEKDGSGTVAFKDKRSRTLEASVPLPGVPGTDELQRWLDREFFDVDIDSDTCTTKWFAGERMDWQMAVSAMFPR
jgi:hypothetical protein